VRECYQKAVFLNRNDALSWLKLGDFHERHHNNLETILFYSRAVTSWLNAMSEHATRASRIYHARFPVNDDTVPNGFLWYCSPSFDVSEICLRLATLYEELGNPKAAKYYEDLSITLVEAH